LAALQKALALAVKASGIRSQEADKLRQEIDVTWEAVRSSMSRQEAADNLAAELERIEQKRARAEERAQDLARQYEEAQDEIEFYEERQEQFQELLSTARSKLEDGHSQARAPEDIARTAALEAELSSVRGQLAQLISLMQANSASAVPGGAAPPGTLVTTVTGATASPGIPPLGPPAPESGGAATVPLELALADMQATLAQRVHFTSTGAVVAGSDPYQPSEPAAVNPPEGTLAASVSAPATTALTGPRTKTKRTALHDRAKARAGAKATGMDEDDEDWEGEPSALAGAPGGA